MANKSTVATDLRRFATFVQGLVAAADTLDQMQQIEEQATAQQAQAADAAAQLAAIQADITAATAQLADIRAKGAASVEDAGKRAQDKADTVLSAAQAQAGDVVVSARMQAASVLDEATRQREARMVEIESMGDQLLRMTEDRAVLADAIASGGAELADIEGRLVTARAAVAKLLG